MGDEFGLVKDGRGLVKDDGGLDAEREAERDGTFRAGMGMGGSAWMVFSYLKPTRPKSSLKGTRDEGRRLGYRRLENLGGDIVCVECCKPV